MISIKNLSKSFGSNRVLENISVDIQDGEVIAIIGPSGCGKSTFLRCINLLEKPDAGQIIFSGTEITAKGVNIDLVRRQLGMVYQNFNLFSHKTVLENIILTPMHVLKWPRRQAVEEAMRWLELVGLTNRADYLPDQLSGGQKQRAAIARCLAMRPHTILFDEPTSSLDPGMVDEVLAVIRKLVKTGLTCIIVTHEMAIARSIASQVFYMDEKTIYEKGPPAELFNHPQREKTRIFISKLKVFSAEYDLAKVDIYEVMQQISQYCARYDLPHQITNRLLVICEELLIFYLKHFQSRGLIKLTVAYNEADTSKEILFADCFPPGNPLDLPDFDEISRRLIQGLTRKIDYQYADEQNRLRLLIQ